MYRTGWTADTITIPGYDSGGNDVAVDVDCRGVVLGERWKEVGHFIGGLNSFMTLSTRRRPRNDSPRG